MPPRSRSWKGFLPLQGLLRIVSNHSFADPTYRLAAFVCQLLYVIATAALSVPRTVIAPYAASTCSPPLKRWFSCVVVIVYTVAVTTSTCGPRIDAQYAVEALLIRNFILFDFRERSKVNQCRRSSKIQKPGFIAMTVMPEVLSNITG